ncbi:glutamyl-tRNA(Gln) amidotransferase subunit B, mitochondrial [Toxorhynchites rutilus septentrionalis]|uniref:glutamyl-tRNA(Gln) amidotransferase subunit B, mitochondrial n=1 Tax=Toxorhynchites rutilus septentrionalis TaxID=329112 RepID=UPI0024790BAB|nr:glutamyl-tRNA(Gln) amidotransferase subunit B, mitochondrial [Toxorhynchites rutilus septentrionalis]
MARNILLRKNQLAFIASSHKHYATKAATKVISRPDRWKSVIGLEIHAQIQTASKLFSGSEVAFGAPINTCVSLFDASTPGTLPVLNRKCVELGVRTALALDCEINPVSMFDRKHYFYADLPAGYQITQQRAPLARSGTLRFPVFVPGVTRKPYYKSARLLQLQLEQDSGKSLHDPVERKSLVDLNRAGIPLMELVFEPDLETGEEAAALVKEMILILTRLGSCNCRMEEGALRVDANISVHRENTPLGTRTEVKNIGSVRAVAQAVEYEVERQIGILNEGGRIFNETRAWDAVKRRTIAMRDKEVVQDYRFMPEPNLPPLHVRVGGTLSDGDTVDATQILADLPELPEATRNKLVEEHLLTPEMAIILVNDITLHSHFRAIAETSNKDARSPKTVANFLINELLTVLNKNKIEIEECKITSAHLAEVVDMLESNTINPYLARLILQEALENVTESPSEIAKHKGWLMITDVGRIEEYCRKVIKDNPKVVEKYRNGKDKMLYALAGEIAKLSDQKVDMAKAVDLLKLMLKNK